MRRLNFCLSSVGLLLLSVATAEAQLQSYYNFDNEVGTAVVDQAGSNNGTVIGSNFNYTASANAGLGNALHLTATNGTYVELANGANFSYATADPRDNFSVSLWLNNDGGWDTNWEGVVAKGEGGRWRLHRNRGSQVLSLTAGGSNTNSSTNFNDSDWHHVIYTYLEGVEKKVFVDGVLETTGGAPGGLQANNTNVQIGGNPDAGDRNFTGFLDDVAFWTNPDTSGAMDPGLTDAEAIALYNLAVETELQYNAGQAAQLYDAFDNQGSVEIGDLLWSYDTGLVGANGSLTGAGTDFALVLDAGSNGAGLTSAAIAIPEPASIAIWAVLGVAGFSGLALARRQRK